MPTNARLFVRMAAGAIVVVFVAVFTCTLIAVTTVKHQIANTLAADTLSHQYQYVDHELWSEAFFVRSRSIDPRGFDFYAYNARERKAAAAIAASIETIIQVGNNKDQILGQDVLAEYGRYVEILRTLFAQIDTSDPAAAKTFARSMLLFNTMQYQIDTRTSLQHRSAITALQNLADTQTFMFRTIILGALFAGAILAASAFTILRFRRMDDVARLSELTRLARASVTDTLTGLENRQAYQEELDRNLVAARRHGDELTLALLDVDDFKRVNDTKGHIYGDNVLASLAEVMRSLRRSDRSFRLGGDEFAIILPHTNAAEAMCTLERLRVEATRALNGITVSIGVSTTFGQDVDAVGFRAQADAALYLAKHRGRNGVVAYTEALTHPVTSLPNEETREPLLSAFEA